MENLEKSNQNPEEILNPVEETTNLNAETELNEAEIQADAENTEPTIEAISTPEPVIEEAVAVVEEPVAIVEEPVAVVEEPVAVVEEPVAVFEEPVAIVEEPVAAVEEPVAVVEEPVAVVEEPVAVVEEEMAAPVSSELDYLEQVSMEDQQDKQEMVSELAELQLETGLEVHHDDDDDAKHEEIAVPDMNFEEMSREELVDVLEQSVQEEDLGTIKNRIGFIKVAFLKATKELRHQQMEAFLAEGGNKEEYEQPEDQLEERFKKAFNVYRQNRIKFNEDQEKVKTDNLEAKKLILEDLKKLIASDEGVKKTYDKFKSHQKKKKIRKRLKRKNFKPKISFTRTLQT